jgi:ornithine cyclodeaminase
MLVLDEDAIRRLICMEDLIQRLAETFRAAPAASNRTIAPVPGGRGDRLLLSMPAFSETAGVVKLATVFPDNRHRGQPTIQGVIVCFGANGDVLAVLDAPMITKLRTGAASALASSYLSRADSRRLTVIGAGALAPWMALAHATVRPIAHVTICARDEARALACTKRVSALMPRPVEMEASTDVQSATSHADIICCATSSPSPVLRGDWLAEGTFVDLVGSFSPKTREADDAVMRKGRIFVDTMEGALSEAGDILIPLREGRIAEADIVGELAELVRGNASGRLSQGEITVFKSVGAAIEDYAAAQLAIERAGASLA